MHDHLRELGRCSVNHAAQSSQRFGKKYCGVKNHTNAFMLVLEIWEEILLTMLHYVRDLGRDIVD
jgi:hypothetical protein